MKRMWTVLSCAVLILQMVLGTNVLSADKAKKEKYTPLDMVVVVDTSGSMKYSDSKHITPEAINMLINITPAEKSRVGVVTFNTKATALTGDDASKTTLFPLKDFNVVKSLKQKVSGITYKGDTGIGNAIKLATDILAEESKDPKRQKAILLFTDGVDDFGADQLGLAMCKENQSTAVKWAGENDCPIYCVGYNYKTASGTDSMGKNGEGITKLESISKPTGGQTRVITTAEEAEDMFIKMLADIIDVIVTVIDDVPGDGGRHEVIIPVSPEVIEANIRITCNTPDALKNGKIELHTPDGTVVPLRNDNSVRYDVDATAANIKVLSPKTGNWKLVLDGIKGDGIKIGMLAHYELGIVSELKLPEGNPEGVAFVGDNVSVQAYLTNDGQQLADNAIYKTIKKAEAVVTPRAAPENKKVYPLSYADGKYTASFTIGQESAYDVKIEIASDSFIRSDELEIQSGNRPLVLDKSFEDVKLNKKKQLVIDDIYTYVSDPEQDAITAEVTNSTDPDMAAATVQDDKIIIDGLKWGATNVTVTFKDAHGNTVSSTFKVSVKDPVMLSVYIGIFILLVILALLILYWLYRKTFRITGKVRVLKLSEAYDEGGITPKSYNVVFQSNYSYDISTIPKKNGGFGDPVGGFAPAGGFGDPVGGFAPAGGFGDPVDGFDTPTGGFDAPAGGFGDPVGGFAPTGGFDTPTGGFAPGGDSATPDRDFATPDEEVAESVDDREFNGEMELGLILSNEHNLYKVLDKFAEKYEQYMTVNRTVESKKAKNVRAFINQLAILRDAEITGSSAGLKGIQIKLPKKSQIKSHSLRIEKFKIKTNVNSGKFVIIKLSIPRGEENGKKTCYYLEVEYKN